MNLLVVASLRLDSHVPSVCADGVLLESGELLAARRDGSLDLIDLSTGEARVRWSPDGLHIGTTAGKVFNTSVVNAETGTVRLSTFPGGQSWAIGDIAWITNGALRRGGHTHRLIDIANFDLASEPAPWDHGKWAEEHALFHFTDRQARPRRSLPIGDTGDWVVWLDSGAMVRLNEETREIAWER